MIRVCHMSSTHKRYDGRIFDRECRSLSQNNYEVYYIVNDLLEDEEKYGVKIKSTNFIPKSRKERILISTKEIYKKAVDLDADIYHFHDPELLPIGLKLKKKGKKVIFDSHEGYALQIKEKQYIPAPFRGIIAALYNLFETYVCHRIDAVVVPSNTDGKNIFDGRAKKIALLNNVPRLDDNFKITVDDKIEDIVCYTGALTYARGIEHLIKACFKANKKLILAGNILDTSFKEKIINMPEFSIVDFRGLLPKNEVSTIYNESSIGACTLLNIGQYNKGDNLATKVYEYMYSGIPVVISESKYVRKVLKEYEFGIAVNPENVDEISDAIIYLCNNKDIAKKMGMNGKQAVKEKFNWLIEEKNLLELYDNL